MIFNNFFKGIKSFMNTSQKTIGTHSGTFHMDEVLAVAMLTKYTKDFKDAKVLRSRDDNVLNSTDLVLDVGRIHDPSKLRFDHHQKEFTGTFNDDYKIKLSSAGLIYKHFGKEVIRNIAEELINQHGVNITLDQESLDECYMRIYDNFILYVDAVDNGVDPLPKDVKPKYKQCGHLAQRVGRLNPASYEKATYDERFSEAIKICDEELRAQVQETVLGWLRGKKLVEQAVAKRNEIHESGEIIKFEESCPWKSVIYKTEEKNGCAGQIKFVLFPDEAGGEGWRVQTVPIENGSFVSRKSLKSDWCGVAPDVLRQRSGLSDAVFCHVNGFIAGCRTFESALKMAVESLKAEDKKEYNGGIVNGQTNATVETQKA